MTISDIENQPKYSLKSPLSQYFSSWSLFLCWRGRFTSTNPVSPRGFPTVASLHVRGSRIWAIKVSIWISCLCDICNARSWTRTFYESNKL